MRNSPRVTNAQNRAQNLARIPKQAVNVSLPSELVAQARELGIGTSQASEAGLRAEIARERGRRWREENRAAIGAWNAYVEQHGVPLAEHRQF